MKVYFQFCLAFLLATIDAEVIPEGKLLCPLNKTRPDTRQSSRGGLGRRGNAKTARNSTKFVTDAPTYRPTRQGVESKSPRLKVIIQYDSSRLRHLMTT